MFESARQFFEEAEHRIDPSRTVGKRMSYRFDIDGAGSWHLDVDDGKVTVEERAAPADCVIEAPEETFLAIVSGEQSPMGAYMRGKVRVRGDIALAARLRELLS
ncbi:MAG: SCP2 sterol-binding domain-containing protein [Actinomycetota bacterium]|nr:SCP2 sterol-binding domain-containing protein [Actinomycetota bacterium]